MPNHILLIEDNPKDISFLMSCLETTAYTFDYAKNAAMALQKAETIHYDLFIISLELPEMDGLQLLEKLSPSKQDAEAIMVANAPDFSKAKAAYYLQASSFLVKPFSMQELLETISMAFRQQEQKRQEKTNKHLLEDRLKEKEGELKLFTFLSEYERSKISVVLNALDEGLIAVDNEKMVVLINRTAEQIFSTTSTDCLGVRLASLPFAEGLIRHLSEGDEHAKKVSRLSLGKKVFRVSSQPIHVQNNIESAGFLLILQDATEEERTALFRDNLLSIVAHELRTPLTALINYFFLIQDKDSPQPPPLLDEIRETVERLKSTVNTLIRVTQCSATTLPLNYKKVDMTRLTTHLALKFQKQLSEKLIHFSFPDIGKNIQESVFTDEEKLSIALECLMDNAIKFSPEQGRVTLTCKRGDGWFSISITDEGTGIPATFAPFLFTLFSQQENNLVRTHGGMGTGLFITHNMMRLLSGSVDSRNLEKGAQFTLYLPDHRPEITC